MPRPSYLPEFAGSMASVATHALVRKTYALLASTLVVTAVAALFGTSMAFPYQPPFILMILAFGVLFAILFTGAKQGPLALPLVFVFTGFIGLSLGPCWRSPVLPHACRYRLGFRQCDRIGGLHMPSKTAYCFSPKKF